jgi:PAS domain S-box-containing protein
MKNTLFENLRVNAKNLEYILDHLRDGIIAHDLARKIIYFNRAAEEITGFSKEEVLGRDCHAAFGRPFCGKDCSFCGGAPRDWADATYPLNVVAKGGEPKQVEMSVIGMTDDRGRLVGVLAALREVTSLVGLKFWQDETPEFAGIIGRNPLMIQVFQQIQAVAEHDYPVLITGETGTGKELVAAAIHRESRRSRGPCVAVNCGALPENLVESELFGHVKGAFSGAWRDKKGRFELAHRGVIFLDEVAELSRGMQVKLLRVLETGAFERVGGEKTLKVDVRVVSATNRDLKREMEKKNFREDLYYRLNVVPIHLPPVRARVDDISLLVEHFLGQERNQGGKTTGVSREALAALLQHSWPGNVRELQNAIHYALARCKGRTIKPEDLPEEIRAGNGPRGPAPKLNWGKVKAALKKTGGNKARAAKLLGVGRATLYRFLVSHETQPFQN